VFASNVVGDTAVYPAPSVGFPTRTVVSGFSNTAQANIPLPTPAAPANLTATILSATQIRLNWADNSNNETGFAVWRSTNGGAFTQIATVGANVVTFTNGGRAAGNTYAYYVTAVNAAGPSAPSNTVTVNFRVPAAPTGLTGSAVRITGNILQDRVTLNWTDNANNEAGFQIQRAINPTFPNPQSFTVGANTTTFSQNVSRVNDFYYRVRATNAIGNSGWSNVVFVTTP
jgi:predicted phage tail protein